MSGFIKLYRGWENSPQFRNDPYCERAAWCWLLSNAAWKETTRHGGKGNDIAIQSGEIHVSDRSLASVWGWDKKRVRRFLTKLDRSKSVRTKRTTNGTILTIENWEKYQGTGPTTGPTEGPTKDRPRTTQEEGKEGKEEKNRGSLASRPADVSDQVWQDFKALRRAKRAPLTDTAMNTIRSEAEKAGWSIEAALTECVARGWQAFKAGWVSAANDQSETKKYGEVW